MRFALAPLFLGAAVTLAGCGGGGSSTTSGAGGSGNPPPPQPASATIDLGTTYQTIRGFGGSTAWMPQMPTALASALFGTGSGQIGLSLLRVRIDPSSTTGGANWAAELGNAKEAIAAGANVSIIATPWTPPAAYKSSSSSQPWASSCGSTTPCLYGGYLDPSHYADYANYLESFVTYMANGGVTLYGISMQNEPDANVTYESCDWTGAQMDTWVANNASVLTTKLIMPESEGFNTALSDPALNDPSAVGHIGLVGGHIYGTQPFAYTNAASKGKEVWMTEYYVTPTGTQPTIGDALTAAKSLHDGLTTAGYNAYVWWWAVDWNPGTGVTNTGLVDTSNNLTYFGDAMGQFSRFIRPGYVRVGATASPAAGVYLSAFTSSGHLTIVALNQGGSAAPIAFTIQNGTVSSLTPYQTTASGGLAAQAAVSVSAGQFTYTLPAQSITTLVE